MLIKISKVEYFLFQGAKRSRPPPNLRKTPGAKSLSPESRLFGPRDDVDSTLDTMEVEEPKDADEQVTPTKRQRTVEIEEVDDDVEMNVAAEKFEVFEPSDGFLKPSQPMPASSSNTQLNGGSTTASLQNVFGSGAKGIPFGKSSLPTQPSKLRASFTAEEDEPEETRPTSMKAQAPKINGISGKTPKEMAMKMDVKALPAFVFQVTATVIDSKYSDASAAAKSKALSALPTFDLFKPIPTTSNSSSTSAGPAPPVFTTAAAAQKSTDAWTCTLCMLKNPASVTDKCTVLRSASPGSGSFISFPWHRFYHGCCSSEERGRMDMLAMHAQEPRVSNQELHCLRSAPPKRRCCGPFEATRSTCCCVVIW